MSNSENNRGYFFNEENKPLNEIDQKGIAESIALALSINKPEEAAVEDIPLAEEAETALTEEPEKIPVNETAETSETAETTVTEEPKKQNVTITDPIFSNVEWDDTADSLNLPSDTDQNVRKTLDKLPNVKLTDSADSRKWASVVAEGMDMSTYAGVFEDTLFDEKADFHQGLEFNGKRYAGNKPRFKAAENETLKGERAVIRVMSHLGLGSLFQAPLWHSGFWVTFKAPLDSALIELNRIISSDKIEMGRHTYGIAFSNLSSYTTDRLVNFAIDHIYDMTVKKDEIPKDGLKSIIKCQDYPSLIWGLICTMYTDGFQYSRGCINEPEKCNHVVQELLNVSKIHWVNRNALTDWQRAHMSERQSNRKDYASIIRYQEEMVKLQKRTVQLVNGFEKGISLTLKTPNLADYISAGHRWIGDIVDLVDRTLSTDAGEIERDTMIKRHCQSTTMRQYVHWVESIELDTNSIEDTETIEKVLDSLSSNDYIRNSFIEEVVKYINESSVAVVGIPVYDCPNCKKPQDAALSVHKNIIPLDVNQVFFGLLSQRLAKIDLR